MEKIIIGAQYVEIHCYVGKQHLIYNTLTQIRDDPPKANPSGNIKIIFFVLDISLKDYTALLQILRKDFETEFKRYFINLLIARTRAEVEEQLTHLRMVNQQQFEFNYLKLQEISKTNLQRQLLQAYIAKKFKWNRVKTAYFLQKNNIRGIEQLLAYDKYPYWEKTVTAKTIQFRNYCEAQCARQETEEDNAIYSPP